MATVSRQIDADDATTTQSLRSLQDLIDTQSSLLRRNRRQAKRDINSATSRNGASAEMPGQGGLRGGSTGSLGLPKADTIAESLDKWMGCVGWLGAMARLWQKRRTLGSCPPLFWQPHDVVGPRPCFSYLTRLLHDMIENLSEQRAKTFARHRAKINSQIDDWTKHASAVFKTMRYPWARTWASVWPCTHHAQRVAHLFLAALLFPFFPLSAAPLARNTSKMKALNSNIGAHLDSVRCSARRAAARLLPRAPPLTSFSNVSQIAAMFATSSPAADALVSLSEKIETLYVFRRLGVHFAFLGLWLSFLSFLFFPDHSSLRPAI